VTAVVGQIGGLELMRPGCSDAPIIERAHHIRVGPVWPRLLPRLTRWQVSGSVPSTAQASSSRPKSDIVALLWMNCSLVAVARLSRKR
jgi:hypothetical protein